MRQAFHNKKQKVTLIIFGIEVLMLLILIMTLFLPNRRYYLTDKDNCITLPYGRYFVNCEYNISSDTDKANYLFILNENGNTEGILTSQNFLHHEKSEWRAEFWVSEPNMNVKLEIRKQDQDFPSPYLNYAKYEIESTKYVSNLGILFTLLLMTCTVLIYLIFSNIIILTRQKVIYGSIMFVVFLISCIPLVGDSLIKGDDTIIHLVRLEGMKSGYLSGQFPVKVEPILNGGYGYAFSTYYGSLFYNIPVILRLMGLTIQDAYRIYVIIVNLATVYVAYYSFKIIFKKPKLALVSTIMYSLSLLRIVDLYQRGAVGEFTALIFLPLIVAGLWNIYTTPVEDENYKRLWIMPVIGYFGVIQSHVLSTEIFGAFTVFVCLIMFKKTFKKETFLVLLKIVLISIVLNIGYLLPFIESYLFESTYINSGASNNARLTFCLTFTDLFKFFYKFVKFSAWRNYMVPGLGPTVIPAIVLLFYTLKKGINKHKRLIVISGIITVITAFLSLDIVPYERVLTYLSSNPTNVSVIDSIANAVSNLVKNIQFAMRFITVGTCTYIIFIIALLSQYSEEGNEGKLLKISGIIIVLLTVIQFIWASKLTMTEMQYTNLYTMTENDKLLSCQIGNYEYLPLRADGGFPSDIFLEERTFNTSTAEVTEYKKNYNNVFMHVTTGGEEGRIELPLLYYRGYKAVDIDTGEKIKLVKSENAQLLMEVNSNYDGNIKVYYASKIYWHIAELISLITFIWIVIYAKKRKVTASDV